MFERLGKVGDVEGVDEECGVSDEMREGARDTGDDRGAAGHGFEDGETKTFVKRREEERGGATVKGGFVFFGDVGEFVNVLTEG